MITVNPGKLLTSVCYQGDIAEAQQLFQEALQVTEQAQVQAVNSDVSDDDWESSKLSAG